jgi:hypothetical protein
MIRILTPDVAKVLSDKAIPVNIIGSPYEEFGRDLVTNVLITKADDGDMCDFYFGNGRPVTSKFAPKFESVQYEKLLQAEKHNV